MHFAQRESNARLVKWSDGSQQLLVGVEALDMTPRAMDPQIHFLYAAYPDSNPDVPSSRRRAKRSRSRTGGGMSAEYTVTACHPSDCGVG